MEQKRTLWILIAAGLFLCLVFGAAFMMSKSAGSKNGATAISLKDSGDIWIAPNTEPKNNETKTEPAVTTPVVAETSNDETTVSSSLTTGLDHPAEGVTTAPSVIQTENLSVIANGPTNVYKVDGQNVSADGTVTTTFDFASGTSLSSAVTAQNKAAETAMKNADSKRGEIAKTLDESTKKTTVSATTVAKPVETKPAVVASTKPASTTTTKSSSTKTVESSKIPDRYWVQAASYSSKKKADEARAILDENKVQCEVFTFEMDGTLYYRVRVGPYTTQTEAAYWKNQVDAMEQFADAGTYIVNSSAPIAKN